MSKPLIAVTGKNGQLGWELQQLAAGSNNYDFIFVDQDEMDLGSAESIHEFFSNHTPSFFINCAAYTAVDKAETEQETAYRINAEAPGLIASACSASNCVLVNISTDYVFDGNGKEPYRPDTQADPINYYGYSKWVGEKLALKNNPSTIIIRTSWLYSRHGNNFVKTMMRLMKERKELKVVADQVGSPTYAADLAAAIMPVVSAVQSGNRQFGIYHYSDAGVISWYDFATAIRDISRAECNVLPIASAEYPTPAKRPSYSVMDTSAIVETFGAVVPRWRDSLEKCMTGM